MLTFKDENMPMFRRQSFRLTTLGIILCAGDLGVQAA
jgi:hypothetical protein